MPTPAQQLIPAGLDRFGALVHAVERWDDPTPCSAWTVRDLVGHLVAEHRWAPHLLAGETLEQVGDRYDGDLLGDDPVRAWDDAARGSRAAWASADLTGTARFSFGEAPMTTYAEQMLIDLTVHGWDLARATGQPEDLDPAAVDLGLAYARPNADRMAALGIIDPPIPTDSADPAVQLLALLGRRA
ncbi:TIGR03086 family metal-binding protein [Saccharopolyspora sp. 7B]|uniref:TIGR03086 family metal-binding protein n=1 Tax=Saccharopolyspora sp. 7B TaxID=2877240 RepID=UPI001CD25BEF|nr:TIGR03086 family metal-binding protein [Saccharopolyspora sp. 7B]MCA1280426.1 TIGR03086 family protein [Saccharopolyspora sp. 7B]